MDQLKTFQYGFKKAELRSHSHHHSSSSSSSIGAAAAIALCNEIKSNLVRASTDLGTQANVLGTAVSTINCNFTD